MKGFGMISVDKVGWLQKARPVCGPLDAIVKPTIVAPCSSDTHVSHGGTGPRENLILGHEAVGIIEEVGKDVTKFKKGDFVVVPCVTPDWLEPGVQNFKTFSHDAGMMKSFKFLGSKDGVFGKVFHVNMADANLAHLVDGVSPEAALMTVDMMSTGFHGVELADVKFGDSVCVIGIGPVGLMAVAGAALRGAGRIIAVGTRPISVQVAKDYGATDIISYKDGDIVEQVLQLTGSGVDSVIIAGGNGPVLSQAIAMTREMGTIASVNFYDISDHLEIPTLAWGFGMSHKDIRCGFCPGGAERVRRMMEILKYERLDIEKLITHKFHGWNELPKAFSLMDKKAPDLIKPIIYLD
ncbi:zinc-binding dehydrogenase [Candidatus Saccharibacteria bacterium]|nr:zinc-binding dehydrogenase [Candidatus Saccharibacteria bacterium]